MRIALVIDYSLDLIGGAQRAALNEAEAWAANGHRVLLVAPRPVRAVLPDGVDALWTDGRALPLVGLPAVIDGPPLRARMRTRFLLDGVDAVHVHSEFGHATAAIAVAREIGLPVLHTVHTAYWPAVPGPLRSIARRVLAGLAGPVPERSGHPLLDRTLATAASADAVVSPSAHQAADLLRLGVRVAATVPNCEAGEALPAPLPVGGPLRVAWIGRCVPEKRLLAFVHAVGLAQHRLPDRGLEAVVVGAGFALPAARLLGRGVPSLRFVGRLEPDGVRTEIEHAHLVALTSLGFDNQPMTVVEAVAAGRGVLHVDPRLTEGLDRAGLLAPSPDAHGIADLLVDLALDRRRVREAAAGARNAATIFSPEAHLAALRTLLAPVRAAA